VVVCAVAAAGCGGGSSGSDEPAAPDPARDRDVADAAAFHLHDFPDGWQQIDFEALGAPPTMETLAECLGETSAPTAQVVRGYRFGPGINEVAVSQVRILGDLAAAQAEIAPTVDPAFVPCVAEGVKGLLSRSIGEGLSVGEVTGTGDNLSASGANGVGVDMLARVQSATGERQLYPSAMFLQKGRAVVIITLLSNNRSVADTRRALAASVAGRLPAE
jgi:hypothetical protein